MVTTSEEKIQTRTNSDKKSKQFDVTLGKTAVPRKICELNVRAQILGLPLFSYGTLIPPTPLPVPSVTWRKQEQSLRAVGDRHLTQDLLKKGGGGLFPWLPEKGKKKASLLKWPVFYNWRMNREMCTDVRQMASLPFLSWMCIFYFLPITAPNYITIVIWRESLSVGLHTQFTGTEPETARSYRRHASPRPQEVSRDWNRSMMAAHPLGWMELGRHCHIQPRDSLFVLPDLFLSQCPSAVFVFVFFPGKTPVGSLSHHRNGVSIFLWFCK